jgi:hypothetical protein
MARKPTEPAAVRLAQRLRDTLHGDPDWSPDDVPTETAGVMEPGAIFHVNDAQGHVFTVRIYRTG